MAEASRVLSLLQQEAAVADEVLGALSRCQRQERTLLVSLSVGSSKDFVIIRMETLYSMRMILPISQIARSSSSSTPVVAM